MFGIKCTVLHPTSAVVTLVGAPKIALAQIVTTSYIVQGMAYSSNTVLYVSTAALFAIKACLLLALNVINRCNINGLCSMSSFVSTIHLGCDTHA